MTALASASEAVAQAGAPHRQRDGRRDHFYLLSQRRNLTIV
jgi:hypothetical protein